MQTAAQIQSFFDEATNTITYLVSDPETHMAAVIDPVLDYDHRSGTVSTKSADQVLETSQDQGLTIQWVLETHAHADHLSAAPHIKQLTGARIAIGAHITQVQKIFSSVFNLNDISEDGSEFDKLLEDGEILKIGNLSVEAMHTPGHTPACMAYRLGDAVFVGDTLFMPDYGTARADFPGGSAQALYQSIQKLLALPPETRLFMCHDYKTPERDTYVWETTVAEQRAHNVHVHEGVTEQAFVAMRTQRDATLAAPTLLLPSIQVNIRAGRFPEPESNGTRYLKIPVRLPVWNQRYATDDFVYGTEPNTFLVEHAAKISGSILSLAEGEGRNAVFLAQQGHQVLGVDSSAVGLQKARKLAASKNVKIQTQVVDLATYTPPTETFDAVVSIFAHLPSLVRKRLHEEVADALKPGGIILLEGYSKAQPKHGTGGPQEADMLLDKTELEKEFPGWEILLAQEIEREVIEGKLHTGLASVVQFIARKPQAS